MVIIRPISLIYYKNNRNKQLENEALSTLMKIKENLLKIGFKHDEDDYFNLTHDETDVRFHIAYDIERKEVILCFKGMKSFF